MHSHTKGPWQVTKYPKVFSINAVSGRQIAIMTEHYGDCPMVPMSQFERSEQDKADAYLISAAPDLLSALEMAIKNMSYYSVENHFAIEAATAAIKKAKGEA